MSTNKKDVVEQWQKIRKASEFSSLRWDVLEAGDALATELIRVREQYVTESLEIVKTLQAERDSLLVRLEARRAAFKKMQDERDQLLDKIAQIINN